MKRVILIVLLSLALSLNAFAQKGVIGEKAASLDAAEWVGTKVSTEGKPLLLEFFLSSNRTCVERVTALDNLAEKYAGKVNVVVVAREPLERLGALTSSSHRFSTVIDSDGKIFSSFGVKFVPYTVIVDSKGRVAWVGNSNSLTDADIKSVK